MLGGDFSHLTFPSCFCHPLGARGREEGASPKPHTHPAPNQLLAEHVLLRPAGFAPSLLRLCTLEFFLGLNCFRQARLLLAYPSPHHPPHGSPHPLPVWLPLLVEALPGTWQISEKPAGQIVTNETKQEGGEGRGSGGGMTPGLVLLFPSLMFRANNHVNAQEQLWTSPVPSLGGVWERWVPARGNSPHPAPPASPQPPGPERDPAGTGKGTEL